MDSEFRNRKSRENWIKIYKDCGSVTKAALRCGIPRSTLYRWIKRFELNGIDGLKSRSRRPLKLANQKIGPDDEGKILFLRKKNKWGPQRLSTYFLRDENRAISPPTIWRVLKKHQVKSIKKYRRHKDYKRYSRPIPGDRVQIDVTKIKKDCYQYTAIDDCTRLKVLRLYPKKNTDSSIDFLGEIIDSFGNIGFVIQRIQSDNGREFYNQNFQYELLEHKIKFRPIPPASPHLNGKVERGQKTDKEEFYRTLDLKDKKLNLKAKLAKWEHFYNYSRPHSSINGKTPYEQFLELESKVPYQFDVYDDFEKSNERIKDYEMEKYKRKNPKVAEYLKRKMSHMS